jgi:GDP-L-fucose synthase
MVNDLKKLLFLGSSCIYPKLATQPITEDQLMTGALEPTNDAYAIAKIAGIKLCQSYREQYGFNAISLMPTNLYGPNDNFDLQNSHVLPALIRKFHEAKESNAPYVECWGDGSPMREFLHVDDLAEACFRCMISYNDSQIINVGTGEDLTIKELTELISIIIGYNGEIRWDDSKPNGTLRKVLNVDKIKSLGWSPKIGIRQGIYETYEWYKKNAIFL